MRVVIELEPSPAIAFYSDGLSLSGRVFGGGTTTLRSKMYKSLVVLDSLISRLYHSGGKVVEVDSRELSRSLGAGMRFVRQFLMVLLASCLVESVHEVREGRRVSYRIKPRVKMPWSDAMDPLARASSILRGYVLAYDAPRSVLLALMARGMHVPGIEGVNSFYSVLTRHMDRLYEYILCSITPCHEARIEPINLRTTRNDIILSVYAVSDLAMALLVAVIAGLALPAKGRPYLRAYMGCETRGCRRLLARLWGLEAPTEWLHGFYEHMSLLDVDSALNELEKGASENSAAKLVLSIARTG